MAGNRTPLSEETITTRERILREASRLFAVRGYYGTSTRDIARAVGIRQPSLFHHFPNKEAIFQELLSYSLDDSAVVAEHLAGASGNPAARLYRFPRTNVDVSLKYNWKPWLSFYIDGINIFDGSLQNNYVYIPDRVRQTQVYTPAVKAGFSGRF